MMDSFLMDRDFTKIKVGSNLQIWMQNMLMIWQDELMEDVMMKEY